MPQTITVLDQNTINKIAAGEVIERPASVVKELLENAIDARATAVTVEIKDGGTTFIRVTDNGTGIPRDQIALAFLSHATSKIKAVEDLFTVSSLGFRGEALSSIAAVSQVELITKTSSAVTGSRYQIQGGKEQSLEEIGAPEGTTFIARNLFYNTPARRKFLKTPTTEGSHVAELVEKIALSHPEVSIRFIQNNQNKLHTSGNHNVKDIIYTVFGREIAANLLPVSCAAGSAVISGFIGKPVIARGNRNYENYFINGRYIRSSLISKAIEEAYKPYMMQHKYPFTMLYFSLEPDSLDVNVHPTKMELRFSDGEQIYKAVLEAVSDALAHKELIPEVELDRGKAAAQSAATSSRLPGKSLAAGDRRPGSSVAAGDRRPGSSLAPGDRLPGSSVAPGDRLPGSSAAAGDKRLGSSVAAEEGLWGKSLNGRNATEKFPVPVPKRGPEPFEKHRMERTVPQPSFLREDGLDWNAGPRPQAAAGASQPQPASTPPGAGQPQPASTTPGAGQPQPASTTPGAGQPQPASTTPGASQPQPASPSPEASQPQSASPSPEAVQLQTVNSDRQTVDGVSPSADLAPSPRPEPPRQLDLFDGRLLEPGAREKHKLIGQLFNTYWLVEYNDQLYIIDQHAAHEKVLYERTMASLKTREYDTQLVNPPIILTLSMNEEVLLKKHMEYFTGIGFEIEPFGGREYAVRGVPSNLLSIAKKDLLMEMIDGLSDDTAARDPDIIYERVASMSCKAAVKGNHQMSAVEANGLIDQLLELENPYACPHGRPTIISMSRYELEKKFKRIV